MLFGKLFNDLFFKYKETKLLNDYKKKYKDIELLIKPNDKYKDKYLGKRCFIFGNGPSLKKIDFSLFENEYVFTVNQIAKNPSFFKLKSNFHFWTDQRFFEINADDDGNKELLMSMKNVNTENNKPEVFFDASAYDFVNKYNLGSFINVNYLAIVKFNLSLFFSKKEYDLSTFIPDFSTVVQTCICSAMYMGFKKIVLLGCDQTSILNVINSRMENAHVVDYAYEISVAEQKRLEEMAKKTTLSEEFASQAHVFETYSFLSNYCCQKGIELVNATDGSLIESIKKVELEDVLQK